MAVINHSITSKNEIMKKTLHILGFALLVAGLMVTFTSCGSKKSQDKETLVLGSTVDTSGLAEFQDWKRVNETKKASDYYMQGYKDAVATAAVAKPAATKTRVIYKRAATPAPAPVAQTVRKKGWSKAAKGTAIGTASGALAGALINKKNRLAGGIIGGLLGAGGGYLIGHGMDKKDGRY